MKVILVGGGTAGHINPAIAIANTIKKYNAKAEILFVGTAKGMEADIVKKAGYNFRSITVKGFQRKLTPNNIVKNIDAIRCLFLSNMQSNSILKEYNPDIVVGTGGYVSGPMVINATKLGIKTAIHEQNAFPGITNKILAPKVDIVFIAVDKANERITTQQKAIVCGNPVRESIIKSSSNKAESRSKLNISDQLCILSFGGSLGAEKINEIAADLIEWNVKNKKDIVHIHAYGKGSGMKNRFNDMLSERQITKTKINSDKIIVKEYIEDIENYMSAADIIICRAGAMTISEIQVTGKASILVPSPYVAENHQYHNAMALVEKDAAIMIEEKKYKKNEFLQKIEKLYKDPETIKKIEKNAKQMAILDTNEKIYIELERLYKQ